MEYTKDVFFKINYNTNFNKIQKEKEKWTSRLLKKIQDHKLLTTVVITFVMFSIVNIIMIYSFMQILQNI